MSINDRHKAFIDEYVKNGFNGTQAYLSVYPNSSEEAAAVSASELLRNPKVKEYLKKVQQTIREKDLISKGEILEKLIHILNDSSANPKLYNHAIKSSEVLSKMLGFNEPDQLNVNGFNLTIEKPSEE